MADELALQQRLLDVQKLKKERAVARREERAALFKTFIDRVKLTAAKQVYLKRFVFLSDEELRKHKLTDQQIAVVRQWEQPKRNAAFTVESSSKLIEAETRAQGESKKPTLNIQNAVIQLPEKREETATPIVIEVVPESK